MQGNRGRRRDGKETMRKRICETETVQDERKPARGTRKAEKTTQHFSGKRKRKKRYRYKKWRIEDDATEWNLEIITKLFYGVSKEINFP